MEINSDMGKGAVLRGFPGQCMMKVLVFSILIQAWSLWGITQFHRCDWERPGKTLDRLIVFLSPQEARADVSVFGPKEYVRTTGKPNVFTDKFSTTGGGGKLIILNGDPSGQRRISSAIIQFNGNQVFSPNDFNQSVYRLERNINLAAENTLRVELRSEPNSYLTIQFFAIAQNHPPVANAGPDQTTYVGNIVQLDGSQSSDADGDLLTYRWSFVSRPAGSSAVLSDPTSVRPYFTVDRSGIYSVQLIVNDGKVDSAEDVCTATTGNSRPVANAGPDQTVYVGNTVQLDGSRSSDVDGDPLTYRWSLIYTPAGSTATLSDPNTIKPTFIADRPGTYMAQLIVNDGPLDSLSVTCTITTENSRPVANAGADQTAYVGDVVQLDGSRSTDVDGDLLTYRWSFVSKPAASSASLSNPASVRPTFVVDLPGIYVLQLIVNDGQLDSLPVTCTITTGNSRPVASAGPDQTVYVGNTVQLDGSGSRDADGDTLSFWWSFTSLPSGSNAVLSNPAAANPTFTVDHSGTYILQLIVNDGLMDSAPDSVTITTTNSRPVANAGPDQAVFAGNTVTLDGSGSNDVDGDPLTFQWSFTSLPYGSGAILSNLEAINPSFVADQPGIYVVQLIVNDGAVNSYPATVTITANPGMVNIPNVVGLTQAATEAAITGAGLVIGTITSANSATVPAGSVISQNPTGGTLIFLGSSVSLVVSIGPVMVTVPNVVGLAQAAAQAAVTSAGLAIGTITTENSFTIPAGSVISQDPAGGISLAQGSPVNLVISVGPQVEPQPEGSFGAKYQDLVPAGATLKSYDPKRFSLITGLVQNLGGSPASDVSINILGHSEYGTAKTDSAGRFSIPVEGGGPLTVTYGKEGLITTHRKVYVPWNDIAIAETIEMLPEDTKSTILTLDGNPNTILTHQSTIVTDDRGSRSSTVVFTGDNRAYSVDASGQVIQELTTFTTRATEFTTPYSMPAKLPPNSAYTYCVELSVDGAQRVRFDKPVTLWVDNFLRFNVGEIVPVGYYDRDRGVWAPSDNGIVVQLLDTNRDGIVDALDSNGDGQPDDLNGNGSFSDEVIGLSDPQKYLPGSTFWRLAVNHFTPLDCNWPYGFPDGAIAPNPNGTPEGDQQKKEEGDCKRSASVVEERSRIFHEDIPIPGTALALHYVSNRVEGYQHKITIPVSGTSVPPSLKRIIVKMSIAGRYFEQVLNPLPDQMVEFNWDGLDYLGKPIKEPIFAHISVAFVYNGVYRSAGGVGLSFGQIGGNVTFILTREEIISWMEKDLLIYRVTGASSIGNGWSLSNHHYVSPIAPSVLFKGDGSILENQTPIINTVTQIAARYVAIDASGNIYIAETNSQHIWKIDANGTITRIAGRPESYLSGYAGDGGPATDAILNYPSGLAVDTKGNLYFADSGNARIRKVDTSKIITTVAGNGAWSYSGDGGPATQASLFLPNDVALDAEGNLYINDGYNCRIRKVDTNGIITTIAGNGIHGYSGDGGKATDASIYEAWGVAVDSSGNIYISDTRNNRIRKIDASGIITTVAGTGESGYSGDGWLATQALINNPISLAVDASGNIFFADQWNNRIRKVDTSGVITTVAGNGLRGDPGDLAQGDGGAATQARVDWPVGVAVDPSGNLYIGEMGSGWNQRLRKVALSPGFSTFTQAEGITFGEQSGLGHIMNSTGRHKSTIDLDRGRTLYTFGYDSNNNLVSISDQFGNTTTIQRDTRGSPTAIVSPDSLTTTLTIDANNNLTRITHPDGSFYSFEYTSGGLMTAKTEPQGNRFEHMFDSIGRLTDATDQEGGHLQYTRSVNANGEIFTQVLTAEGNLTSYLDHTDSTGAYTSHITDPAGAETIYTRSAGNLTATKSFPCGMNLTFKYGVDSKYRYKFVKEIREKAASGLERIAHRGKQYQDTNSDAIPDIITENFTLNDKLTSFVTNTLQSKKTLTSPVGRTITTFYDPNNLLTKKLSVPGLYDTNLGYDTRGRLTSIKTDTRQTTLAYDTQGNLSSITDPENHITNYTYDLVGRMTGILRPDGSSVGFTYDKNGNMTALTNPSTITHNFGYSQVNLNTSYQTPLSGAYSYLYDRDRRPKQINFPSGRQIQFIYDKDRLIQTQTPEGNISLTYLCGSKVDSMTKGTESIQYGYDGSLVISEAFSGTLNQILNYSYNNDFRLTGLTYAGGSVPYSYDDDGLLTQAGNYSISRNSGNGLPQAVTGGALNITRTFDGYGEIGHQDFTINSISLTSWDLTRDNAGRIITKTEMINGVSSTYIYTYDSMGRLLTVTQDGNLVEKYRYGPNATRISEMNALRGISGRDYTYDAEDHLLTAGNTTYQYDADGFLTTKTRGSNITRYSYSSRGELLSVGLPDGRFIEYIHDPSGRRIAKKIDGVITEKYLWQGLTRLLAVYDSTDNVIMRFEYADARMPVAMTKAGTIYYLTYDQVGSLRVVADTSGNVVKRIDYDSFGSIINDTNSGFVTPFGFAGGLHDRDTGLVRFGFRDYDPEIGRWIAKDPILFGGGDVDLYGYLVNNPVSRIDPLGLQNVVPLWIDIAALSFSAAGYFFYPPLLFVGTVFSIAGTVYTAYEWSKGNAEWYDFAVSLTFTLIGFYPHPVTVIGSDIGMLLYDVYRLSEQLKSKSQIKACK